MLITVPPYGHPDGSDRSTGLARRWIERMHRSANVITSQPPAVSRS